MSIEPGDSGSEGCEVRNSMNILFLSQIIPYPPHGGVLQRGYNIIRELNRHCRVHLLAFVHKNLLGTEELLNESRRELLKYCTEVEYFDLWPKRSQAHNALALLASSASSLPFSVLAHRSGRLRRRLGEIVNSGWPDLVHFDTIALSQFNAGMDHLPKVLTHHNIESRLMERRAMVERNPVLRGYLNRQAARLRRYEVSEALRYDINILMSSVDENELVKAVPGIYTAVVPNGVDTGYFAPERGNEKAMLIYTGGMGMFANRDAVTYFLASIWPIIKAKSPEVRFIAAGKSPPSELIDIGKKDASVEVPGYLPDIRPHVAGSAVYVVPLRVGGGTRLKVLDAMAMGKAIVSTSIGCEGIDVTPGVNIMVADDPEQFAERTCELLGNADLRVRIGSAARELVESKYSWEIIGKKLMDAYGEASERGRRRGSDR